MTLRASNGVPFLILAPIPAARTGIRVDIYDGANPANLLAVLEDTWERSWSEPLQGPGSGTFKISALHPKLVADPTLLAYGNIARFNLDDVDRFAISIEHKTHVQAGPAGDVANVITVTGRGVLAKLEEAVAYPQGGIGGDPSRGFAGIAPGHLSRVLIDEAIARGALTGVTRTYTDTDDSNNAPWAVSLDQTERAGTDLLRIHDRMAATAVDVYMKPDLQLWMVNTRGVDRTLTLPLIGAVILQPADNVVMLERSEDGAIRNSILIETPAGFLERTEGASITDHRRREAFLSLGNVSNTDGVDRAADSVFQRSAQPAADIGTEVLDIDGARPYVDWDVGDYVFGWDDTATLTKYRVRALTVTETAEGRPVFVPELSTITAELEDRLERWLAAMSKGTVGGSAADIAEPVEVTAAVTGAVTDGSATAIAAHLAGQPHFDELADLVDVDVTGLAEGDILYYDTTALKWVPAGGTKTDGKVATIQTDGTVAWETPPAGGGSAVGTAVERTTDQTGIVTGVTTFITWQQVTAGMDDGGFWVIGSPTRLTAAATGWHALAASAEFDTNATGDRILRFKLNGATYFGHQRSDPAQNFQPGLNGSALVYLTAGDYVEVEIVHDSGANRTLKSAHTKAQMVKL